MPSKQVDDGINQAFLENFGKAYVNWNGKVSDTSVENAEEVDRVVTNSSLPVETIHGFDNEIKSLKHFLLDQKVYREFKTLAIVGEYGVGKTALCKTIFNDDDVKRVYAPRIWVCLPSKKPKLSVEQQEREEEERKKKKQEEKNQTPEQKRKMEKEQKKKKELNGKICVLKEILTALGVGDSVFKEIHVEAVQEFSVTLEGSEVDKETVEEKELAALLYALHLNLRWKKYLIVFDDVREEDHWDEILQDDEVKLEKDNKWGKYLSDGFPKGSGGRVIYTSRDENGDLAKKLVAEEHEIHRLWPLTDTVSVWNIYEEKIKMINETATTTTEIITVPRNDKKCIDELMNKSRGLPLAAQLLATLSPVFIGYENTDLNGSTQGTTTGDDTTIPPPQA